MDLFGSWFQQNNCKNAFLRQSEEFNMGWVLYDIKELFFIVLALIMTLFYIITNKGFMLEIHIKVFTGKIM